MAAKLELSLLGPPTITLNGEPVGGLRYSKAQALLYYLAVTGRPHSREALAALLWGDLPEDAARTNLRTVLSKLRALLGPYLVITRQTLSFNRESPYSLDVEQFVAYLRNPDPSAQDLKAATQLYRGDLLAGFSVHDAPGFEEWLAVQRDWLQGLVLQALHGLASHHAARHEYTAGIEYLTWLLALDPWREDAHRHLMRLLAASGQRSAALSQYQLLSRTLEREFGLAPSAETVALYEQLRAQGEEPSPAPQAHHLPVLSTPFVQRKETEVILGLFETPNCRLLTLMGPGGIGKSRLAGEVAMQAAARFKHGAWYVPLRSLVLAGGLALRIADSLAVSVDDVAEPEEALLAYLRGRELLLVLDNFEHLLAGAQLVVRILKETPCVKLLITSRERLNVQGEWALSVGGMSAHGALQLFKQSAERAKPGIQFSTEDLRAITQINERVGSVPLAIELAAGWVRTLAPSEIDQEIARSLDFLTAPQDAPERHGSMRVVFGHSWALLSPKEQEGLRRAAVFRNGFSREAAHDVTGASVGVLASLVDKALLYRDASGRYRRHVLVQHFVDEKAATYPEEVINMRERHGRYYFAFLLRHEQVLRGRRQHVVLQEMEAEMDNLRHAWAWALEDKREGVLDQALASLETLYALQGRFREAEAGFALTAAMLPPDSATRARAWVRQANFAVLLGRYKQAEELARESLEWFRQHHPLEEDIALALQHLGTALYYRGAHDQAGPIMLESLEMYRGLDDPVGIANNLNNLGNIDELAGKYQSARQRHLEALALRREVGDYRMMAISLVNLGDVAFRAGNIEEARAFYEQSLTLRREIGDYGRVASSLSRLGNVALAVGDMARAEHNYREALELALDMHALPRVAQALLGMAEVMAKTGREEATLELLALVAHHPSSPAWYRHEAEALFAEVAAGAAAHTIAAAQAKAVTNDLLEVATEVKTGS